MQRIKSHFEEQEVFLEKYLRYLRFKRIIRYIKPNCKMLDLGCGYKGELLKQVVGIIDKGIGIDVSIDHNYKKKGGVELIQHDLNNALPFKNNEFDVVTSLANLEHLKNPNEHLNNIYHVLKPGGILLLTMPTTYSKPVLEFLSYKLKLVCEQEIRDHKFYANKKILTRMCEKTGFSKCKHKYFQLGMNNFILAEK